MASLSLIPAGDFRTSYAADTTIFPTTTSRNAAIVGIILICFAPQLLTEYWLSILIQTGIFRHSAGGCRHSHGRADLRRTGGAAQGALSRHRHARRAIHPARFLLARRLVLRRLGAGKRQSVLDLRLYLPRRPAIFLRGAGLSRGQLSPRHQPDAHARRPRAGGNPRSLPFRGNHGHQLDKIPHAVIRAGGVLRRYRRSALCALPTGSLL